MTVDIAPAAPADLPLAVKPIALRAKRMEDAMRFFVRTFRSARRYPSYYGLGVGYHALRQAWGLGSQLRRTRTTKALLAVLVRYFFCEIDVGRIGASSLHLEVAGHGCAFYCSK